MISIRYALLLSCLFFALPASAQYFDALYDYPARPGILDGSQKTFLVTGYSTSHRPNRRPWPTIFQEMLNAHAGNASTYHVVRHTVSGTPIAKWMGTCGAGGHVDDALDDYVEPGKKLGQGIPQATVMLAQQSLQWAFGDCRDRFLTIEGPADQARIAQGADAIVDYVNAFFDGGIEEVYMATHIYKTGYPAHLCDEEYALAEALGRVDNFYPGPELCYITGTLFPAGFDADRVHPGPPVANAMALYWYLIIAGEEAKPEVYEPIAVEAGIAVPVQTSTEEIGVPEHTGLVLRTGYPNPFKRHTTLAYELPASEHVQISVYNQLGQQVKILVDETKPLGAYQVVWDGQDLSGRPLPSGVYVFRMTAGNQVKTSQTILIR